MAVYKRDIVDIELNSGSVSRSFLKHSIGTADAKADHFGVRTFRDGEPVDLSGVSVQGFFRNSEGTNIAITSGNIVSGNEAEVVLPAVCYNYDGPFTLAIKLIGGDVTGTMRIVDGIVDNTNTGSAVAPSGAVPTYQEVLATYDAMVAATSAANTAIAETFDATKAYPAGKYVINEGALYRLTADHATNVTWANTSKVATKLGEETSELRSAIDSGLIVNFYEGGNLAGETVSYDYSTSPLRKPGYMDKYGAIQGTSSTNRHIQLPAFGIKSIKITPTANTTTLPFAIYTDKNGANPVVLINGDITSETTYTFDIAKDGFITLNYFPTGNNFPSSAIITFYTLDEMNTALKEIGRLWATINGTKQTISLNEMMYANNGYINNYGEIIATSSGTHWVVSMDASNLSHIEYQPTTSPASNMGFGVLKDSNGNKLLALTFNGTSKVSVDIDPKVGNILYVAFYNHATVPNPYYSAFDIIESLGNDSNAEPKYMSCVAKPISVFGKMIYFFGDSITYGYIAASGGTPAHQATNNFPKVFSEGVGANHVNFGVSGSTLSGTGAASIYTKITETNLNPSDVIFVAGGINDWQTGVDETTLKTAVENICSYLAQNYSKPVIFITPINEAGRVPTNLPMQTVQNVRNIITRIALKYGYSVVQGWEFPFPTVDDDADYISLMFQDKLHPTELGYSMYAQALRNTVC